MEDQDFQRTFITTRITTADITMNPTTGMRDMKAHTKATMMTTTITQRCGAIICK
jgi:hypothetical protein